MQFAMMLLISSGWDCFVMGISQKAGQPQLGGGLLPPDKKWIKPSQVSCGWTSWSIVLRTEYKLRDQSSQNGHDLAHEL